MSKLNKSDTRSQHSEAAQVAEDELRWYSPTEPPFCLSGFPWFSEERLFRRLPLHPSYSLPPAVDALANHTAGGQIRFQTDSRRLALRVRLAGAATMFHMPATGQCGFDCYVGPPGQQRYVSTTKFDHTKDHYEHLLFDLPCQEPRHLTINFPLYQGVEEVLVGLDAQASVQPPLPWTRAGKVIAYGTSITQGGCASRPGMAFTNILSRRLNVEFVNLGFSGQGKGEPELAHLIAQIKEPLCYMLDYEANAQEGIKTTLEKFIRILRAANPTTPILVISRPLPSLYLFDETLRLAIEDRRDFQRHTVERLSKEGVGCLYFVDGKTLLGRDFDECTVDGAHPTDLGFMRIADCLEPILKQVLALP